MARVDYEAAWHRLGEFVAGRTQHGRQGLLVEMQRIAAECRVPESELARVLRLYGVEVNAVGLNLRDELDALGGGLDSPSDGGLTGHHDRGGHDGSRSSSDASGRRAGAASGG